MRDMEAERASLGDAFEVVSAEVDAIRAQRYLLDDQLEEAMGRMGAASARLRAFHFLYGESEAVTPE